MKFSRILGLLAVLALAVSGVAAQGTPAKPTKASSTTAKSETGKEPMHQVTGSVVSSDASRLVISHMVKGKVSEMTLVVTPETQKTGSLDNGARVTARYRVENGQNVATLVKAAPAKAKTS